jgi:hypothetical protein
VGGDGGINLLSRAIEKGNELPRNAGGSGIAGNFLHQSETETRGTGCSCVGKKETMKAHI